MSDYQDLLELCSDVFTEQREHIKALENSVTREYYNKLQDNLAAFIVLQSLNCKNVIPKTIFSILDTIEYCASECYHDLVADNWNAELIKTKSFVIIGNNANNAKRWIKKSGTFDL